MGKVTIPVKWKTRENYDTERDFMIDVRLAHTRATILTAELESEKDEKVKKTWNFDEKRASPGMGPQVLQNKESGERPLRPNRGRRRILSKNGPNIAMCSTQNEWENPTDFKNSCFHTGVIF